MLASIIKTGSKQLLVHATSEVINEVWIQGMENLKILNYRDAHRAGSESTIYASNETTDFVSILRHFESFRSTSAG